MKHANSVDYEIRLAEAADAHAIADMSRELIEHGLERSWTAARVARSIRHRGSTVIKAVVDVARVASSMGDSAVGRSGMDNSAPAGFAIMTFADESAHLSLLAVGREYRRLAIARHMLTWLERTAVCAGTFFVRLEVRAANRGAAEFYRAVGYDEADLIEGYYNGVEDALVFAKDLRVCDIT
ncbi:MAG: GNAT family N-acetyltransferase [Gammaproteobacteria bacterium]